SGTIEFSRTRALYSRLADLVLRIHVQKRLPTTAGRFAALRGYESEEIDVSKIAVATAIVSLTIGAAVGGYGGMLYARHQSGMERLKNTYRDTEQQIRI